MHLEVAHALPGRLRVRCPARWLRRRVADIEPGLMATPGVRSVRATPRSGSVVIAYDPAATSPDRLLVALAGTPSGGRAARPERVEPGRTVPERGAPSWLALVGTTFALGVSLTPTAAPALLPLTVASIAPAIVRAGRALRAGRLDVDVLQALGLALLAGRGNFAAANLLTSLDRLGRFVLDCTVTRARRSLRELLLPPGRSALRVERGQPVPVPMAVLAPGDLVSVAAGERLPADGVVASGEGLVDQQAITGEGLPVERRRGDRVFAWSVLEEGRLLVRVEHAGSGTVVGRIVEAVEASAGDKPELQVFAERLADRLVGRTLLLAIAGAAVSRRLDAGTAMLVSDYGLAARVALPTAVLAAIIRASRAGILIKGPRVIEELARVDTVVFDKTGTLTRGAPVVSRVVALGATEEPEEVLRLAAAAGSGIPHPVARAIARAAARSRIPVVSTQAELREGLGVRAMVEGVPVLVGSRRFMEEQGVPLPRGTAGPEEAAHAAGGSVAFVSREGRLAGLVVLHDELRPDAPRAVADLRARRMRDVVMVSGDHPEPARAIADQLGIERWHAEMLPEDKAALVQDLRGQGRVVAMVGDGANDALALRAAQVGIAVQGGMEVVSEAAGVVLLRGGLEKVVEAIDHARHGIRAVDRAIDAAVKGNAVATGLASLGFIGPFGSILVGHGTAVGAALLAAGPQSLARKQNVRSL